MQYFSHPPYSDVMASQTEKRSLDEDGGAGALVVKKQRTDIVVGSITKDGLKRTSNLAAPIMQLSGHGGEVYTLKFSPDGTTCASASYDRNINVWRVFSEECENYMHLKGHRNAVLEVQYFSSGERLVSCSADKTVRVWDVEVGVQVKKLAEHTGIVNCCCPLRRGPNLFVSGGDDSTVKVWDMRVKKSVQTLNDKFQILGCAFADAGDQVYSGGINNAVTVWDLRQGEISFTMSGHTDTITGMRLSPDGFFLLTNSMDNTLRVWDVRPYAEDNRCVKVFAGHTHSFEKNLLRCDWSADSSKVTAGSADRMVYIWENASRRLLYKLPGHTGSVNEVVFHPKEPIVGSCSSDKTIFLGELLN